MCVLLSQARVREFYKLSEVNIPVFNLKKNSFLIESNKQRNSFTPTNLSMNIEDWMLRVVGSDIHLFGNGLIANYPEVQESYDNNQRVSFQLLRIKPKAREALVTIFHLTLKPNKRDCRPSNFIVFVKVGNSCI